MSRLGMPLYGCQTPDGYKNTEEAWLSPDATTRRISFATALAPRHLPVSAPRRAAACLRCGGGGRGRRAPGRCQAVCRKSSARP